MKKYFIILTLIICTLFPVLSLYAQNENLPSDNSVYDFLKKMQVQGSLPNYEDILLPLRLEEICNYISKIESSNVQLSETDKEILTKLKLKYLSYSSAQKQVFSNLPNNMFSNYPKNLYYYSDSTIKFILNPFLSIGFLYGQKHQRSSETISGGGEVKISYEDWLGIAVRAVNGTVKGSREVAKYNHSISQNFNFNTNYLSTYDETSGYINFHKGIFNLELGRERLLFGSGYIDKTILSDNPQIFDFVKLNIKYKRLTYDFLHGWLVSLPQYRSDTINNTNKIKIPKYIAISRLGYTNEENLRLGISQMIIYSQRPFEMAYLNPFLFWESAQRSMNDNDNSFLTFDCRYKIKDGIELNASAIFDDINLGKNWNAVDNRMMWQTGIILTDPFVFENMAVKIEYLQLRPYIFSHYGLADALTYTNNGYILGTNIQPNSTRISFAVDYYLTADIKINAKYYYQLHGDNLYDSQTHKLIKNNGGDINYFATLADDPNAILLAGERESHNLINASVCWEFFPGYYFDFLYEIHNVQNSKLINSDNYLATSIRFAFD